MRYPGKTILLVITALLFLVPCAGADEKVVFSWGFFLKSADGLVKSLDFDGPESVGKGDLLRVYLQLHEKSYVYVFLYDSRKDLYQVFPPSPDFYGHAFPAWQKYYIPSAREWFTLDGSPGVEKFFILAANNRLMDIEELAGKVIFERKEGAVDEKAVEIIEKKAAAISDPQSVSIDPVHVAHTAKLGPLNPGEGVTANRVVANGSYGLVLELVNR
ncbi:MAG: DUF4384 domain-containing protein [Proteobacteria bacterium]|nr:DUF4384 domain-containing protein [Pseudomonadota bacterium]